MWTETVELTDTDWVEQVTQEMLALDDSLTQADADHIAHDLAHRPRWRALSPDAAARKAVDEPEAVEGV